ncbi:hypothetical protein [Oceanospirillum sanctuarii]|uniref:hypothetical protein n=1 Tax=Oceanospirillum sanctuarii TaxID=1434821 RepID=UPI000A36CD00|nr:hypothetical protein [Oceanospirillum sanctuarii]
MTIQQDIPQTASKAQLIRQTLVAFVVALVVLLVVVLPVEFQRDPTGLGAALGLTGLTQADAAEPLAAKEANAPLTNSSITSSATSAGGEHWQTDSQLQSDQLTLTLPPRKGLEVKAMMHEGQRFIYQWQAEGGELDFDMHGEEPLAVEDFTSFWEAKGYASAQGSFTAPFEGSHGWYWYNPGTEAVTLTLKIQGFYQGVYLP